MIKILARRLRAPKDESGAALVTVIMLSVMVFSAILSIASASLLQLTLTANSRQDLEAFASAEAGRDVALAELVSSRCSPVATSTTVPFYTYRIYHYAATGTEVPVKITDPGVTAGCPRQDSTHVLVESTGRDGHDKTIVSTYKWNTATSTVLYGALVSGSTSNISGAGVILPLGATIPGDVVIGEGDLKCSNSVVQGSVYVQKGTLDLQGCTRVSGNTSSKGNMKFSNNNARVVDGNACTEAAFDPVPTTQVAGTKRSHVVGCPGLDIPPWNDYAPRMTGAVVVPAASCSNIATLAQNATVPTVFDARACTTVNISSNVAFKTDVSIVANGFNVSNQTFTSFDGARHMFNMIVPDDTFTSPPDAHCASYQRASNFSQVRMDLPMSGLIYTPCDADFSGGTANWSGQMQVGSTGNVNALLTFVPVSAPLDPVITFGNASPTLLNQFELLLGQSE